MYTYSFLTTKPRALIFGIEHHLLVLLEYFSSYDPGAKISQARHDHFPIFTCKQRIQGECLLILSLPGKALRRLVDIARLAERFNMRSQSRAW